MLGQGVLKNGDDAFNVDVQGCHDLTFAFKSGFALVAGAWAAVAKGAVLLTDNATNYVELNELGAMVVNTAAFTATSKPLFQVTTVTGQITQVIDYRAEPVDRSVIAYSSDGTKMAVPKIWAGTAVVASGVATFYPTDDGTGTGAALFTTIKGVAATALAHTATVTLQPHASIDTIASDKKSITVNALVSGVAGGVAAADGTVVHLLVVGV